MKQQNHITLSKSFQTFIYENQYNSIIARLLYRAQVYREYYPAYNLLTSNKEINYLTFRNDGTISFLPAGKEHKQTPCGSWARDGRQNGKPGKVIRKLFSKKAQKLIKDSDFETFANFYKSQFNDDGYKFEMRPAKDIPDVYCMERKDSNGSLNNSCMNNDRSYLAIYAACKHLQILTLTNKDGLLCGRCLVWNIGEGRTLLDRFYVSDDFMYEKFVQFAQDNKFYYKYSYKSYENKQDFITPDGKMETMRLSINTNTDFDYYPYIDTFCYGNDGCLANYSNGHDYTYNDTNGERDGEPEIEEEDNSIWDMIDECSIDEDDAVTIDRGQKRGYTTHRDNTVEDNNGNIRWREDSNLVEINGDFWDIDDTSFCEKDGCHYPAEDCVYSEEIEDYILENESINIDGDYYHTDSENIVEIDGDYYKKDSDDITEIDGDFYTKDDARIVEIDGEFQLRQLNLFKDEDNTPE